MEAVGRVQRSTMFCFKNNKQNQPEEIRTPLSLTKSHDPARSIKSRITLYYFIVLFTWVILILRQNCHCAAFANTLLGRSRQVRALRRARLTLGPVLPLWIQSANAKVKFSPDSFQACFNYPVMTRESSFRNNMLPEVFSVFLLITSIKKTAARGNRSGGTRRNNYDW